MNNELVKQEIEKIIASEVDAAWRQYPAGVAQKKELTELGIIDLMPANFGHTDAKVVLEALQEKVTGNFDDVVTFKSKLMELINEVEEEVEEEVELTSHQKQEIANCYAQIEMLKSDIRRRGHKGGYILSDLRHSIEMYHDEIAKIKKL